MVHGLMRRISAALLALILCLALALPAAAGGAHADPNGTPTTEGASHEDSGIDGGAHADPNG